MLQNCSSFSTVTCPASGCKFINYPRSFHQEGKINEVFFTLFCFTSLMYEWIKKLYAWLFKLINIKLPILANDRIALFYIKSYKKLIMILIVTGFKPQINVFSPKTWSNVKLWSTHFLKSFHYINRIRIQKKCHTQE